MQEVTDVLLNFRDFLNDNWERLISTLKKSDLRDEFQNQDLIEDWLQVNWEIYVESVICSTECFLEVYASGAECNVESDRVRYPNKEATHRIICLANNDRDLVKDSITNKMINTEEMDFYKFVSMDNNCFIDAPPFEFALLESNDGNFHSVSLTNLRFMVRPL